ncbi:hypothetical protein P152DRAFT_448094 [Eremomyces bilateralis CBS 781.70]|uniref:Uncharacterized protein n=1 Tax=Eremomyces bilateralis CBS 781.70 TaxID=1392243 RepID=A0A6G1G6M2_9PEZI|nr:uncharacterized protein P152DRAFT_448094 [Eremomyces bilateralis CBS 781.70]KAF1813672.1 hypothetical protein P152DRAFT_448094 [Eremomyces bilateralis CBS 781.70]
MVVRTLLTQGPLSTLWTPPASCLSTTTMWGDRTYFMGFMTDVGIDISCYPSLLPTPTGSATVSPLVEIRTGSGDAEIATITGYTTVFPTPTGLSTTPLWPTDRYVSEAAYYSPGICPSGYEYAAPFTLWSYKTTATQSSSVTRFLCCPSGYKAEAYGTGESASYYYPGCQRKTDALTNVWSMTPGWPTVQPTSLPMFETSREYGTFTVSANGIVVGWQATDVPVLEHLKKENIELPPFLPLPTSKSESNSKSGLPTGVIVAIVLASVATALSALCVCITYCGRRRKRRNQTPVELNPVSNSASPPIVMVFGTEGGQPYGVGNYVPLAGADVTDPPPAYNAKERGGNGWSLR